MSIEAVPQDLNNHEQLHNLSELHFRIFDNIIHKIKFSATFACRLVIFQPVNEN